MSTPKIKISEMSSHVNNPRSKKRQKRQKRQKRSFKVKYPPSSKTHIPRGDQSDDISYSTEEDLCFQIVDWYSEDVFCEDLLNDEASDDDDSQSRYQPNPDPRKYTIRVFGVTENGHSVSCIIENYHPYFFIKVPLGWNSSNCEQFIKENITHKSATGERYDERLHEKYVAKVYRHRNFRVENPEDGEVTWCSFDSALVNWEVVKRCDFNAGFTGIPAKQFKFIKLTFSTIGSFKHCYWQLRKRKQELKIDIYEANLDPQLRFMHIKGILAAGWVTLPQNTYEITFDEEDTEISTQIETTIDWSDIQHLERDDISQIRQASFDIECYSHEHDKFPVPEHLENPVIQIGTVIQDYGDSTKYIKHLITLKKCNPIKDTIVICCDTEYELLCKWQQLLLESDPDILIGYNIFGFDLNYLMVRAKKRGCEEFKFLGRMKYQQSELIDKTLSSAAYGDNRFKMVPMPGRLQIDLLQIVLRGMTKYRSYKLANISQEILCSKLKEDPLKFTKGSTTVYVKHANHDFKKGTVIHLFSMFKAGGYAYEDINKMHIITDVVYDEDTDVVYDEDGSGSTRSTLGYNIEMWTPAKITEWGGGDDMPRAFETKFDLPPQQIFEKYASGTPEDMHIIGAYCVQDCMLPQKIINKCNILIDTLEMAKVTFVPTSFLITRGQQIKVFSQFAKKCRERGYLVHTVETNRVIKKKKKKDKYKGATVLAPKSGAYWDAITCLDFKALYPTIEIDWNLCYTTLVKDEKYANLPGVKYHDFTVGLNTYRFAQSEKGIVPEVLEYLLNARGAAKVQMYNAKTPFMKDVYNGKQLALKVTCNSVYGFTGCGDTGMLPCKPIAEVTTTVGRGMIEKSKQFSEDQDNFSEIIGCVDWFPLEYYYLCMKSNGKHCLLTTDKLLKIYKITPEEIQDAEGIEIFKNEIEENPFLVWTSEQFQQVTGFESKQEPFTKKDGTETTRFLYKVNTVKGDILNMQKYKCETIYGDTDSVFNNFNTHHHSKNFHKIAYSMITGGYVADRITEFLRSLNPYKPYGEQWTELEYEKVYLELMLLTKKRYLGSLYEFNPYKKSYIDKKGVALKRRDYCHFVHDVFKAVLKCIFDDKEPNKDIRIQRAVEVVTTAVKNLLENKIPFERLILSKLLKGRYKIRDQTKKGSFNSGTIKVDDLVKWEHSEFGMCTGTVRKKHNYSVPANNFFKQFNKAPRKLEAQNRKVNKDLDVWMNESESGNMPADPDDMLFHLGYDQIKAKCGYEITLDKIMDPKTPEKELVKVTQAHARLARKMYKRDPGSAPKSGSRLQYMFVQSTNPKAKQYEKSEAPEYVIKHNLKPDPIYYLEHQLAKPMIQLFELWVKDPEILFRESMRKYRNVQVGQREISSFFKMK